MKEKARDSEDKMNNDPTGNQRPVEDDEFTVNVHELEDFEFGSAEFSSLNSALDQLQGALDNLESRNAGIHEELLELLQSNREVRRIMQEERENSASTLALDSDTKISENMSDPSASCSQLPLPISSDSESKTFLTPMTLSNSSDNVKIIDPVDLSSLPELLTTINVNDNLESQLQ